jgi:hypothetical protein
LSTAKSDRSTGPRRRRIAPYKAPIHSWNTIVISLIIEGAVALANPKSTLTADWLWLKKSADEWKPTSDARQVLFQQVPKALFGFVAER